MSNGGDVLAALHAAARCRQRQRPTVDRRSAGQFSTPPSLVRAIVHWALPVPGERDEHRRPLEIDELVQSEDSIGEVSVLDPATGGGLFARAAIDRLVSRRIGGSMTEPDSRTDTAGPSSAISGPSPAERVTAVDSDPAALARACDHLPDGVRTVRADFLSLDPTDVGRFHAIIGNPPYLRQERLDDAARDHLATFGPPGETPYLDGDRALDARCDGYVYFLTNATRLLLPGGRLGFVMPTKWLATKYGETVQQFLLDHYLIDAVIGFDDGCFPDAAVDAGMILARRRPDSASERSHNDQLAAGESPESTHPDGQSLTRFIRFETIPDAGDLLERIRFRRERTDAVGAPSAGSPKYQCDEGSHRTVAVEREELRDRIPGKLTQYLDAPAPILSVLEGGPLVPLAELANISYGHKTGANEFFLNPPVHDRFLSPAVMSIKSIEGRVLDEPPTSILDVHEFVTAVRAGETPIAPGAHDSLEDATLAALAAGGYDRTARYIRSGRSPYSERATCAGRPVWFDLGPLDRPAALHPKFFDERITVIRNRANCVPGNAIECLDFPDEVPVEPLLGALNGTLHAVALECWGRREGGGALQLMTYELRQVPVIDVRQLSQPRRNQLSAGFHDLVEASDESAARSARHRLDAVVLDAIGVDIEPTTLRSAHERMVQHRIR